MRPAEISTSTGTRTTSNQDISHRVGCTNCRRSPRQTHCAIVRPEYPTHVTPHRRRSREQRRPLHVSAEAHGEGKQARLHRSRERSSGRTRRPSRSCRPAGRATGPAFRLEPGAAAPVRPGRGVDVLHREGQESRGVPDGDRKSGRQGDARREMGRGHEQGSGSVEARGGGSVTGTGAGRGRRRVIAVEVGWVEQDLGSRRGARGI